MNLIAYINTVGSAEQRAPGSSRAKKGRGCFIWPIGADIKEHSGFTW